MKFKKAEAALEFKEKHDYYRLQNAASKTRKSVKIVSKKKQDDDFFTSMSKSFTTNFDAMQKSMNTMFNPTEKKKKSPEKDYVEDLPV